MTYPAATRIVEVVWIDSNTIGGWHRTADMLASVTDGAMECRSVGYVFFENDERLVLIGDQNDNDQVAEAMTIPKVAIKSVRDLKE